MQNWNQFYCPVKSVCKNVKILLHTQFQETKNEERRIFGPMRPLPVAEFLAVYHKTGFDLDGRLESTRSSFEMFEYACLMYVKYAQELPGFDKFGEEDKTSILKGYFRFILWAPIVSVTSCQNYSLIVSRTCGINFFVNVSLSIPGAKSSFWMLADYTTLDLESGLWTWPNYETFDKEGMSIRWFEPYYKKLLEIAEKLQKLHLTTGEENVLRAIVLFNPGKYICPVAFLCCHRLFSLFWKQILVYLMSTQPLKD